MEEKNLKPIFENTQGIDFSSIFKEKKVRRSDRDVKHYAPANKEWKNSVYAFNKSSLSNIAATDQKAGEVIKSYFNLVPKPVKRTKSKRMRDLLRRSSTRQFFVSRPEIKQNNDKAIITVYTHDREKVTYLKKLFMLNRWLNSNLLSEKRLQLERKKSNAFLINRYNAHYLILKEIFNKFRRITFRESRGIIRWGSSRYKVKHSFLPNTVKSLLRKRQFVSYTAFYLFLKWALYLFKIRVDILSDIISVVKKENKVKETGVVYLILTLFRNDTVTIKSKKKRKTVKKTIVLNEKKITIKSLLNIETLRTINILLLQHLITNLKKVTGKQYVIFDLFKLFNKKYFNSIARKLIKKEILITKYMTKLYINKFKLHSYLPALKGFLSNIYNKKVQLNIVNLKSLHLNSDLFAEAVSIKLRDRTRSLFRIIQNSFTKLKIYKPNKLFLFSEKQKNSLPSNVETYFGEYNVINGNVLNLAFEKMFKQSKMSNRNLYGDVLNTLTSLKYKRITGIRLEAAGRLTKRYAAARALFKYRHKGSLRNLEHLKNVENKLQSPSLFLLRGDVRPNIQHCFVPSKRRIGAFGIKSWISSS